MHLDEGNLEHLLRGAFTTLRFMVEIILRCLGETFIGAIFGLMGSWTLWLLSLGSIDREIDDELCVSVGFIEFILLIATLSFW